MNILDQLSAELVIRSGPAGTTVEYLRRGSSETAMTESDVQKLRALDAKVTQVRKEALGGKKLDDMKSFSYKIFEILQKSSPGSAIKPVTSSVLISLREMDGRLTILDHNNGLIRGNVCPDTPASTKDLLRWNYINIRNVIVEHCTKLLAGTTDSMSDTLINRGVLAWFYNKFTSNKWTGLEPTKNLTELFFPSDVSKGVRVTVRELRSLTVIQCNEHVISHSWAIRNAIRDDAFVKTLIGWKSEVDLSDSTNKAVASLLKVQLLLVPTDTDVERFANLLIKRKLGDARFSGNPRETDPKSILTSFADCFTKMKFGLFKMMNPTEEFYKRFFPGADKWINSRKLALEKDLNPGPFIKETWPKGQAPPDWSGMFQQNTRARYEVCEVILRELGISKSSETGKAIRLQMGLHHTRNEFRKQTRTVITTPAVLDAAGNVVTPEVLGSEEVDIDVVFVDTVPVLQPVAVLFNSDSIRKPIGSGAQKDAEKAFYKEHVTLQKKQAKSAGRNPTAATLSQLGAEGEILVALVQRKTGDSSAADAMKVWLRGFSRLPVQAVAANLLAAKYETLYEDEVFAAPDDEVEEQDDPSDEEDENEDDD
jgi:hypothetical protein